MSNIFNAPRAIGNSFSGTAPTANGGRVSSAETGPIRAASSVLDVPITGSSGAVSSPGLPVYYGVSAAGPLNSAAVQALTSVAEGHHIDSFTAAPSNQKVVYAYPESFGAPTFSLDGLTLTIGGDWITPYMVTISGITYTVLETTNLLTDSALPFVRVA